MRVLHFYRTFYPASYGGIEQVIYQICHGCEPRGIFAEVLTLGSRERVGDTVFDTIPVHYAKTQFRIGGAEISASAIGRFRDLAAKADLLHYHFPWPMADVAHLVASGGKPSVLTYHSDIVRQIRLYRIYRPLMNVFLGRIDRIVATSPNYLQTSPVLAQYRDKTSVIPIGLDEANYPAPDAGAPGVLARPPARAVLPVRGHAALLQGAAHPARCAEGVRRERGDRGRRPDRARAEGARAQGRSGQCAASSAPYPTRTRSRC